MQENDEFIKRVRTMQIIASAIVSGLIIFLVIAAVSGNRGRGRDGQNGLTMLTLVSLAALPIGGAASFLLPGIVARSLVRRAASGNWPPGGVALSDDEQLLAAYQTALICGLAPLEGAGFCAGVAYFTEGSVLALLCAALAAGLMLLRFPTVSRVADWVQRNRRDLSEQRQFKAGPGERSAAAR
jgi:hypothetical protein